MPFEIVRNDIVKMQVDAIVNTANPAPVVGSGVDTAIHTAAGPELLKARQEVGALAVGEAAATPAFDLPAKYVIHVAGPVWVDGSHGEEDLLRTCYRNALAAAAELGCESIAFPLLSSGNYVFPKDVALRIAIAEFSAFLLEHDMEICLVVFGKDAYRLSTNLFASVQSYIDENYVAEAEREEYGSEGPRRREERRYYNRVESFRLEEFDEMSEKASATPTFDASAPTFGAVPPGASLENMIRDMDASFSDTLLELIDATGEKRPDVYKRAQISKQHFSKINSDPKYSPLKPTVIAFAMALRLSVDETEALLEKAGFSLSNSILFDVIVMYFLEQKNYDIFELNEVLRVYDQPLVGNSAA